MTPQKTGCRTVRLFAFGLALPHFKPFANSMKFARWWFLPPDRLHSPFGVLSLAFVVWLSGCAAGGPPFKEEPAPPSDGSLLYIYRPYSPQLGLVGAAFAVDGRRVAELSPGGYEAILLKPGDYEVIQTWTTLGLPGTYKELKEPLKMRIRLRPGTSHFVQFQVESQNMAYVTRIAWRLGEVSPNDGTKGIADTRRQVFNAASK